MKLLQLFSYVPYSREISWLCTFGISIERCKYPFNFQVLVSLGLGKLHRTSPVDAHEYGVIQRVIQIVLLPEVSEPVYCSTETNYRVMIYLSWSVTFFLDVKFGNIGSPAYHLSHFLLVFQVRSL